MYLCRHECKSEIQSCAKSRKQTHIKEAFMSKIKNLLKIEGEVSWIFGTHNHLGEITKGILREFEDGSIELSMDLYSDNPSYPYSILMTKKDDHFEGSWYSSNPNTEYKDGTARCHFEIRDGQYSFQGIWKEGMNFTWTSNGEVLD